MTASQEAKAFVRLARKAGVEVGPQERGRYHVYVGGEYVATIAGSPSDRHWKQNAIAQIRRQTGIDLRPEHHRRKEAP